uniref:Large ribosomal subunit protein mL52 n=1 Tax=Eptatretus burgeri TaxID=7764 RepID=A0A8C4QVH5_EPTBU
MTYGHVTCVPFLCSKPGPGFLSSVRVCSSSLSTSPRCCAGSEWRVKHGLAENNSVYGPLTDLPDWSFADGRPAPIQKGIARRRVQRAEIASQIVSLSHQMENAMTQWHNKKAEMARDQERENSMKFKAKGCRMKAKLQNAESSS